MDTSRVDGVKAPLHDGTPRSHEAKRHVKSASPNAKNSLPANVETASWSARKGRFLGF